jgi:hypothetical protein
MAQAEYRSAGSTPWTSTTGRFPRAEPLWLYQVKADWPVARCVVVDNKTKGKRVYGPPEAEGKYQTSVLFPLAYISDYIYIG